MHYSGENQNGTKECIPLLSDGDSCFRSQAATAGCVSELRQQVEELRQKREELLAAHLDQAAVDTELGAKDLLNNRMTYVSVSRGAHHAQLFTKFPVRRCSFNNRLLQA